MISKKKKIFILIAMVALLVVTGYLNIALNNNVTDTTSSNLNFYDGFRKERQDTRDSAILLYNSIIASSSSSEQAKANAEASLDALVSAMLMEMTIEQLIIGLGFEDAVLSITDKDVINVVVKASQLTREETARIGNIVRQQTGKSLDDIKIIPSLA